MAFSEFTSIPISDVYGKLSTAKQGLSHSDSEKRLQEYGLNQITSHRIIWWQILLRQFKSPFFYLLAAAFVLSVLLGQYIDAGMIALFVAINTTLGFFQEYRSEQTIKLLKKYLVNKTKVVRSGEEQVIDTTQLVPGDIVKLEPGDMVPADIRLVESVGLAIDESALTGESAPVAKSEKPLPVAVKEIYKASNICFLGTTVTNGQATGVVFATGKQTNYSEIAQLATAASKESTFEKDISKFSRFILFLILITLGITIVLNLIINGGTNPGELALFAIALAVSVIPEALPVVATFSLSLGARRLAKRKVVVKRLSAIEDLGNIEVLCSDKTGTLTANKLKIVEVKNTGREDCLIYANLASQYKKNSRNLGNNAFELALDSILDSDQRKSVEQFERIRELPFDPQRRRASSAVKIKSKYYLIVRGSPEDIINLSNIGSKDKQSYEKWLEEKGKAGIRVLAVAAKAIKPSDLEKLEKCEKDLDLLGFVGFYDPIKESVAGAVKKAEKLGVAIKILTGDSKEVATSVALTAGVIKSPDEVISGDEFDNLNFSKQHEAVENYNVFARVTPQQKYKIIEILQEKHEVGFLGEGINDAPALKIANVGLVVDHASDIARETADIVLLDKSLSVIVDGIKQGREVFANTNKYIVATLSSNFGNFFAVAVVSLIIDFLPMLPLQILLVNLLSDFPMVSVATDSVESESIEAPRRYSIKNFALIAILLGIVSSFFDFVFFSTFLHYGQATLQTNWFIGSILTEIIFMFSIRTKRPFWKGTRPSLTISALALVAILTTIFIPFTKFGQEVFSFIQPTTAHLALVLAIVVIYFACTEAVKLLYYKILPSKLKLSI